MHDPHSLHKVECRLLAPLSLGTILEAARVNVPVLSIDDDLRF
jgi:hypothetical protein